MIVQTGSTNPRSPVRRGLRLLGLLTPLVLLVVIVGAGVLGPKPEPPAPVPSLAAVASLAPSPSAESPLLVAGPGPGFPTVAAKLGVRNILEARAELVAASGQPIAVAGILESVLAADACAAAKGDTRGPLSPLCERRARLVLTPGAARGEPHLHVLVPPGVRLPPAFEDTIADDPMPVVIVGRGPATPCTAGERGCGQTLTADLVAWAGGATFDPGPVFDAGLQVPPPDIAYRNLAAAEALAIGWSGSVLVAAAVRPATVGLIDPEAAAAMAAAGAVPEGLVWYVRGLETEYGPGRYPAGDYPPRMLWVVLDETTGRTIATGLMAGSEGAPRTAATGFAFPAAVAGRPVLDLGAALAARASGAADSITAVSGWFRAWADPAACRRPIAGLPGGGCPRTGLLVGGPWSESSGGASGGNGLVVHVVVPPGVEIPDRAVGLDVDGLGPPPPVVILGRFDDAGTLIVEAVAWASGEVVATGHQVATGIRLSPEDPLVTDAAARHGALAGAGTMLRMVLAPGNALAAIDPDAAARLQTADRETTAPLWYIRGLDHRTGAVRWAVVEPGTGRVLARDVAG